MIRVSEYPIVNVISFEGNKRLKDEQLAEIVRSRSPAGSYRPAQAIQDAATIAEAYAAQGRLAARVDAAHHPPHRQPRRSGLRGPRRQRVAEIERLSFVGNRAFRDRRLRNVLETKQAGLLRTFIRRDTFVAGAAGTR